MIKDSINHSKTPLQGEAETDPTQQLVVAIKEEFPLRFQEPMVDVAMQHLEVFSKHFSEEDMAFLTLSMSSNQHKLSDFVRFIFAFPLEGNQMDFWPIFSENVATSSDNIEDVIELLEDEVFHFRATSVLFNKVEATSHFLSLDKDSMINEFIIPFYKVSNRKVFDLEEETETAFLKGIKKTFGLNFSSNFVTFLEEPFWIIEDRFSELETSDFVSIFEYVLEQQDEVLDSKKLRKPTSLRMTMELFAEANPDWSEQLIFDKSVEAFFGNDISKILQSLTEYDIENYGQIVDLGKEKLTTFGYSMPPAYIVDSLQIAKELNISDVDLLNFLQGYAFNFDGDALGCFYEAWDLNYIFRCNEEELESELDDLRLCRKHLIGSMIAWQSHEELIGDCLATVKRLAENKLSVCWKDCKGEVLDFDTVTVKDSLQGKLCDFRFGLKIQAEERDGSVGTKN